MTNLEGDWLAEIDHYLPKLHRLSMAFCSGISEEKVNKMSKYKSTIIRYRAVDLPRNHFRHVRWFSMSRNQAAVLVPLEALVTCGQRVRGDELGSNFSSGRIISGDVVDSCTVTASD